MEKIDTKHSKIAQIAFLKSVDFLQGAILIV